MITLNLLPDSIKKRIKLKHRYEAISRSIFFVCILSFVFSGFLYGYLIFLKKNNSDLPYLVNAEEITKYQKKLEQYRIISAMLGEDFEWSLYLEPIFKENKAISISAVKCRALNSTCEIKGQVLKRIDLENYFNTLNQSEKFSMVKENNKNFLASDNFPFTIEVVVKKK